MDNNQMSAIIAASSPQGVQTLTQQANGTFAKVGEGMVAQMDKVTISPMGTGMFTPPLTKLLTKRQFNFTFVSNNGAGPPATNLYIYFGGSELALRIITAGNFFGLAITDFVVPHTAATNGVIAIPISPFITSSYTVGGLNTSPAAQIVPFSNLNDILGFNWLLQNYSMILSRYNITVSSGVASAIGFQQVYFDGMNVRLKQNSLPTVVEDDILTTLIATVKGTEIPFSLGNDSGALFGPIPNGVTVGLTLNC